jgi:hypothetical protein
MGILRCAQNDNRENVILSAAKNLRSLTGNHRTGILSHNHRDAIGVLQRRGR